MTISAKMILDSISPDGIRLKTMQLRYPKFIHGEFMTHRDFSRNASSSRAIPVERLIQDVLDDPAMPVSWGKNQKGMQAGEEHDALIYLGDPATYDRDGGIPTDAASAWLVARNRAVDMARRFAIAGYAKQVVNRIIEPYCHINVVVTATEWDNFYALRRHADADPTMRALADAMWEAEQASEPKLLRPGAWHLPYITTADWVLLEDGRITVTQLIQISTARCARVSYLTHDGRRTTAQEDLELYKRLVGSAPLHASPAEHQATPDKKLSKYHNHRGVPQHKHWAQPKLHGNFVGWIQARKLLPNENIGGHK